MTEPEAFILANHELLSVITQIKDDQWTLDVPAAMSWQPNQKLRDIVNYHIYDDAWVPDVLAGKTKDEVGDQYDALRSTTDTIAEYQKHNARANEAVKGFSGLDQTTHLSYGDFPARDYLQHITLFRGFRVHDIAGLIGSSTQMSDDLVQVLWDSMSPQAEALRQMGVFGPAVPVANDAPLRARLLGLSGRQPV